MACDRSKGEVWVFAEQEDGKLSDVPRELLGKGRELADRLGVPLAAVLMGADVAPLCDELFAAGRTGCISSRMPRSVSSAVRPTVRRSWRSSRNARRRS